MSIGRQQSKAACTGRRSNRQVGSSGKQLAFAGSSRRQQWQPGMRSYRQAAVASSKQLQTAVEGSERWQAIVEGSAHLKLAVEGSAQWRAQMATCSVHWQAGSNGNLTYAMTGRQQQQAVSSKLLQATMITSTVIYPLTRKRLPNTHTYAASIHSQVSHTNTYQPLPHPKHPTSQLDPTPSAQNTAAAYLAQSFGSP